MSFQITNRQQLLLVIFYTTEEALLSGHLPDAKKVSITVAGPLLEYKNTEFVWELRKTKFCEGGCK